MNHARYWFARGYYCLAVLITAWIGAFDLNSQHHDSFVTDGAGGYVTAMALVVFAIAGLLDVTCNTYKIIRIPLLRHYRFVIYLGMAYCFGALISVNLMIGNIEPLVARYSLDCLASIFLACLDLWGRKK